MPDDVHVALLRGVNVSGKNRLAMTDLRTVFADLGCRDVQTYIQSGNVVFRADDSLAGDLPRLVRAALSERFGLDVPVVTRSAARIAAVVRDNPFLGHDLDPKRLHVAFLADEPTAAQVATLEPDRSPTDEFAVRGGEIYLHTPNGMARTRLTTAWFDARLATTTTIRNWRTTRKLAELCGVTSAPSR